MPNLKQDHNYLYKRVRLKAIVHILIGLVFMSFPKDANPTNGALSNVQAHIGDLLVYFGFFYLMLGILIGIGVFLSRRNYFFARFALTIALVFNVVWLTMIAAILVQHATRGVAYVLILTGYLTYNLFLIWQDPAWRAIEIIKEIVGENGDARASRPL